MQLKKKILKVLIIVSILTLLACSVAVPVSAFDGDFAFKSVVVAGQLYPFENRTISVSGNTISLAYPYNSLPEAEFHFNTPVNFATGDIVSISFNAWVYQYGIKQIEVWFGGQTIIYTTSDLVTYSDSGTNYFNLNFNRSYKFNSASSSELIIIVRSTETAHLGFSSFEFLINNDPAVAMQQQTDQITQNQDENTDKIMENDDENTDKIINEGFGYEKPSSGNTDDGLKAGGSLIDSLNEYIDEFNEGLDESVGNILDAIKPFKEFVHKLFDILPQIIQYLITFAMVFLVLRKVVGR